MVFPVSYIVLMFHVGILAVVLGVRRGVSLAPSFRLYCTTHKSPRWRPFLAQVNVLISCRRCVCSLSFFTGRVVSPTQTPVSSWRVGPALVASYDMHGRAVDIFYAQPTGHKQILLFGKCLWAHVTLDDPSLASRTSVKRQRWNVLSML